MASQNRMYEQQVHSCSATEQSAACCVDMLCRFVTGDTLVVDGGAWLHRPQLVPRDMVSMVSRGVEKKSRQIGTAGSSSKPSSKL
jgi:hypothetical protein